jgi:glycosyltransferase involved in cell wall biosynthesis
MKKISVIIPVKNRASLLPYTLDNILFQTLKPYEVIVIDDGSNDNLKEVITLYKDRVIFIKNTGKGPGAARNEGYKISTGEYIQFFDSDDLMTKSKLEVQASLLSKTGSGMCYSPHVKASMSKNKEWEQMAPILYYYPLSNSLRYDQWVLRGACMITQACLFDRMVFNETGLWRTDLMSHEDLEFLFRIGKVVPYPVHSDKVAVMYRQHGEQITDKAVSNESKTIDQYYAWNYIKEKMDPIEYNYWDFMVIKNNILNSYKHIRDKDKIMTKLNNNIPNKIFDIIYRIQKKHNRYVTKSEWQILHGISLSKEKFNNFKNDITTYP